MPELTKDRLVAILNERIADEKEGLERYDKIWRMVHESTMPIKHRREFMDVLNKILADEEIHIELLQEVLIRVTAKRI